MGLGHAAVQVLVVLPSIWRNGLLWTLKNDLSLVKD